MSVFYRYFVQGSTSNQNVEYTADDWGFHPLVEYSNVGPNSRSTTQIALGQEAVNALRNNGVNLLKHKLIHIRFETKNIILG